MENYKKPVITDKNNPVTTDKIFSLPPDVKAIFVTALNPISLAKGGNGINSTHKDTLTKRKDFSPK